MGLAAPPQEPPLALGPSARLKKIPGYALHLKRHLGFVVNRPRIFNGQPWVGLV